MKRLIILSVASLFLFALFAIAPVDKLRAEQQNNKEEADQGINTESKPVIQEINNESKPGMETDEAEDDEDDYDEDLDGWC